LILIQPFQEQIAQYNGIVFTKSRAINMTKQNKSTSETPGAQIHMLSNIPVKFHETTF
jgi:hypothetical protein